VENITEFLLEYNVPIGDLTLHLVFIETRSGENPVMTVTYFSSTNTQIVEKGWVDGIMHNSYTGIITEAFAIDNLVNYGDCEKLVNAIISNYDSTISLLSE
jgi:hypothetical protein